MRSADASRDSDGRAAASRQLAQLVGAAAAEREVGLDPAKLLAKRPGHGVLRGGQRARRAECRPTPAAATRSSAAAPAARSAPPAAPPPRAARGREHTSRIRHRRPPAALPETPRKPTPPAHQPRRRRRWSRPAPPSDRPPTARRTGPPALARPAPPAAAPAAGRRRGPASVQPAQHQQPVRPATAVAPVQPKIVPPGPKRLGGHRQRRQPEPGADHASTAASRRIRARPPAHSSAEQASVARPSGDPISAASAGRSTSASSAPAGRGQRRHRARGRPRLGGGHLGRSPRVRVVEQGRGQPVQERRQVAAQPQLHLHRGGKHGAVGAATQPRHRIAGGRRPAPPPPPPAEPRRRPARAARRRRRRSPGRASGRPGHGPPARPPARGSGPPPHARGRRRGRAASAAPLLRQRLDRAGPVERPQHPPAARSCPSSRCTRREPSAPRVRCTTTSMAAVTCSRTAAWGSSSPAISIIVSIRRSASAGDERMHGRQRAVVAGGHRLQHVQRLGSAHLPHHDPVGAHPQRVSHQRAQVDGAACPRRSPAASPAGRRAAGAAAARRRPRR